MREGVHEPRVSNFRLTTDDSRVGPERADVRDSASSGTRYLAIAALAVSLAVLALAACGPGTEPQGPSVSKPGDIVALMDTPRLTSLSREGRVVTAEGQATTAEGDDLRTYWFTTVGALAYVQEFGGSLIVRKVLDGTTLLDDREYSGKEPVGTLADPATFLSEEDLNAYALRHADAAGVVVEVNYVPFFGGTAEFVLRPTDEFKFMSKLDEWMYEFFSDLPQDPRPTLVTIVDSGGANRRVQGWFPLSDGETLQFARLSDGTKVAISGGEGFAWQADDLTKKLGVDASGRPVEGAQPVEGAPGP